MKIVHYTNIEPVKSDKLGLTGSKDLSIRFLVTQEDGAPNFSMLLLELLPKGYTPDHSHQREEEIFVKAGKGELKAGDKRTDIRKGDVLYFLPDEKHQFINTGSEMLELLCVTSNMPE